MDLARAPRRAPLTARKKGSGYENGSGADSSTVPHSYARSRNLSSADLRDCEIVTRKLAKTLENLQMCSKT